MSAPKIQLTQAQLSAVTAAGHVLCCACPGSGKTRVITEKIAHIFKVKPDARVIVTTFSRDATQEMRERISKRVTSSQLRQVTIGTYHALGLGQLKKNESGSRRVLSAIETRHLMQEACHQLGKRDLEPEEAEDMILQYKIDPGIVREIPEAQRLAEIYQKLLEAQKGSDFTDMLVRAVTMMEEGKLAPIPADFILADEFQDVDRLQLRWLGCHIAQGAIATAVGDDDQSVYAFRRALGYQGMMEFVSMTDAEIITLDVNYRSTAGILNSAGRMIAFNLDRVPKKPVAHRGDGPEPWVIGVQDDIEQTERIIEQLDRICTDPPPPNLPGTQPWRFGVRPGQVAILARTNRHLDQLERELMACRIPCVRPGKTIWKDPAVEALLSLLTGLHQGGGVGFDVALRWAKVPRPVMEELTQGYEDGLVGVIRSDVAVETMPGGPIVTEFIKGARIWLAKLATKDADVAGVIWGASGWMAAVMDGVCGKTLDDEDDADSHERKINPHKWKIDLVANILSKCSGTIQQRISLAQQEEKAEFPRVVLLTFHASKGLEWDHVFLVNVIDGAVPKRKGNLSEDDLAEERRIFYVAMTRARDELYILTRRTKERVSEFILDAGLTLPASS